MDGWCTVIIVIYSLEDTSVISETGVLYMILYQSNKILRCCSKIQPSGNNFRLDMLRIEGLGVRFFRAPSWNIRTDTFITLRCVSRLETDYGSPFGPLDEKPIMGLSHETPWNQLLKLVGWTLETFPTELSHKTWLIKYLSSPLLLGKFGKSLKSTTYMVEMAELLNNFCLKYWNGGFLK